MPWVALAVAGAGVSVYGGMQQASAQKEAEQAQSRMESLKAARERTQQIRNANTARAGILQAGANQGAAGSSSVATGASGVTSEAMGNIQQIGYEEQTGLAISRAKQKQVNAQGLETLGSGITEMAGVFQEASKSAFGGP